MQPGMTVSAVERLHSVSPSLLFQGRRRMAEDGQEAVSADEEVVPISRVRQLENCVPELERLLGRKTMETEILRETLEQARPKNTPCACRRHHRQVPGKSRGRHNRRRRVRLGRSSPPAEWPRHGPPRRAGDGAVQAETRTITDARPTYGYRRITALLNRARRSPGEPPLNHKRIFHLVCQASLLLQPHTGRRAIRAHAGSVVPAVSNQRWASDCFETPCWNGEVVRVAFAIDTHDCEVIA